MALVLLQLPLLGLLVAECVGMAEFTQDQRKLSDKDLGHTRPAETQAFGRVRQLEEELQRSLRIVGIEGASALEATRELLRTVNKIMEHEGINKDLQESIEGSLEGSSHLSDGDSNGDKNDHRTDHGGLSSETHGTQGSVILQPRRQQLAEDLRLAQSRRIVLNHLDHHNRLRDNRLRISCTRGLSSMQAFEALPACPNFQPCSGFLTSRIGEENMAIPLQTPILEPGSMEVCSAGFSDPDGYYGPVPPRNCRSWYTMDKEERARLVAPYLQGLKSLGRATSWLLQNHPELGCAHRADFVFQCPVSYSVYKLRSVYISGEAVVFNRTTTFLKLGCRDGVHIQSPSQYSAGSVTVKHVGTVVNWAYRQGSNFYHSLIECFPMFLSLAPILSQHRDLPLLGFSLQFEMYRSLLAPLVGVPLDNLRRYVMGKKDLVHAETIYQPVYQYCGRLSRGLWTALRRGHLLHPEGIPLFNPDWSMRHTTPLTDQEMMHVPEDWVVVMAKRPGNERALDRGDELLERIKEFFTPSRVVVFQGDLDILQARDLFRRARLFIAAHGAAMANMIFMPVDSSVIEIRPDAYQKNCYHSLADACLIRYNLLIGEGTKSGKLYINIDKIMNLVQNIAHEFYGR